LHICPELKKIAYVDCFIALTKFALFVMMFGDFPPNYKVTLFKFLGWQFFIISHPTAHEPVKATLSTSGCLTR
jgi:hypothetical protein